MSTLSHGEPEKLTNICFKAPEDFKVALDIALATKRTTIQDFCLRAIAEKLGIPVPGEEPTPEPKRRRA